MRRELSAIVRNLRLAQEDGIADFIEGEGYIPDEEELEMLTGEEPVLAMDTSGLPIAHSDHIKLTADQLDEISEDLIDGDEVIVNRDGHVAKAKIVYVDTAKISAEAKEMRRNLIADLREQMEETGEQDIDQFLRPDSEVYELDLTCPNCGDHECFPSFTEDGLQHYTCNQCGTDFVSVDEPAPVVETETIPIDEYAEIDLEHEGSVTRWALSVDGEVVDEGEVEDKVEEAGCGKKDKKVSYIDPDLDPDSYAWKMNDGIDFPYWSAEVYTRADKSYEVTVADDNGTWYWEVYYPYGSDKCLQFGTARSMEEAKELGIENCYSHDDYVASAKKSSIDEYVTGTIGANDSLGDMCDWTFEAWFEGDEYHVYADCISDDIEGSSPYGIDAALDSMFGAGEWEDTYDDVSEAQKKLEEITPILASRQVARKPGKSTKVAATYQTDFLLSEPVCDLEAAQEYLSEDNMADYFDAYGNITDELVDAVTRIDWILDDEMSGHITVETTRDLEPSEMEAVSDWIVGQNADGIGEGFEQRDFACFTDESYYWDHDDWESLEPNPRDFDSEEDYEAENEYWWESEPSEEDYMVMCSFDWETNDYPLTKVASHTKASRRAEAVKQANLAYYRRFIAFRDVHTAGDTFVTREGDEKTVREVTDSGYILESWDGTTEEIGHDEMEQLIACGEFTKKGDDVLIDDVQEGDEFDDGEGRILVESRTRNEIFGIYTPYDSVRTAAEEVFVENAHDFCRRVQGMKKISQEKHVEDVEVYVGDWRDEYDDQVWGWMVRTYDPAEQIWRTEAESIQLFNNAYDAERDVIEYLDFYFGEGCWNDITGYIGA